MKIEEARERRGKKDRHKGENGKKKGYQKNMAQPVRRKQERSD